MSFSILFSCFLWMWNYLNLSSLSVFHGAPRVWLFLNHRLCVLLVAFTHLGDSIRIVRGHLNMTEYRESDHLIYLNLLYALFFIFVPFIFLILCGTPGRYRQTARKLVHVFESSRFPPRAVIYSLPLPTSQIKTKTIQKRKLWSTECPLLPIVASEGSFWHSAIN